MKRFILALSAALLVFTAIQGGGQVYQLGTISQQLEDYIANTITDSLSSHGVGVTGQDISDSLNNAFPYVDSTVTKTGGINSDNLRDDVVDSTKVRTGGITNSDIRAIAIDSTKIRNGTVSNDNLRALAVDSTKVRDGSISADNLRSVSVDSSKVRAASIAGSNIVNPLRIPTNTVYALNVDLADSLRAKSAAFTSYFIANGPAIMRGGATITGTAVADTVNVTNFKASGYGILNGAGIFRAGTTTTGSASADTTKGTNAAFTGYIIANGNATIRGNVSVTGGVSYRLPHAFIGFSDSAYVRSMNQNVWYSVSNVAGNLFAVVDTALITYIPGDTLLVQEAGDYHIIANLSFSGNNGETWRVNALHADTTKIGYSSLRYTSSQDTGNLTYQTYHTFTAGEKLFLGIKNISDNDDATLKAGSIYIRKAH